MEISNWGGSSRNCIEGFGILVEYIIEAIKGFELQSWHGLIAVIGMGCACIWLELKWVREGKKD